MMIDDICCQKLINKFWKAHAVVNQLNECLRMQNENKSIRVPQKLYELPVNINLGIKAKHKMKSERWPRQDK